MISTASPAFLQSPSGSRWTWFTAAIAAICLHLAVVAFALVGFDDGDTELGAPGIEIGLELTSPQTLQTDLPPGPDSEAVAEAQASQQRREEKKSSDQPEEEPTTIEQTERQVTQEKTEKKTEAEQEIVAKPAPQSEASVAQEATATPWVPDSTPAQKSVTIDQGTDRSRQRVRATWQKELVAHLDRHKRYPPGENDKTARIKLTLELDRIGRVVSVNIAESSGNAAFDAAAIAMVQRSNPVPPPPPIVADEGLQFSLPVLFRNRGKQ